ncbi:MAG: head decoration protein [Janthinobacterium lividum]
MTYPIPAMSPYPQVIAGGFTLEGSTQPFELFCGDQRVKTEAYLAGATAIPQFTPCTVDATGMLAVWDGGATTTPHVITAQPIAAATLGPCYIGGGFNHEALSWPATVTTLGARKAAFRNIGGIGVNALI